MEKVFLISNSANEEHALSRKEFKISSKKCFIQYFIENIDFYSGMARTNFVIKLHDLNYLMDFCIDIFENGKKELSIEDLLLFLKENATKLNNISKDGVLFTLRLVFKSQILTQSILINFIKRLRIDNADVFCPTPKKRNNHEEDLIKTIKPQKNIKYQKKLFFENPQLPNTFADIYLDNKKSKILKDSIEKNSMTKLEYEKYIENNYDAENLFQYYLRKFVDYFYKNENNKEKLILCGDFCLEKFCQVFENDKNYFLNEILKPINFSPVISEQQIFNILFEKDGGDLRYFFKENKKIRQNFYYFRSNLLFQLVPKNDLYANILLAADKNFKRINFNSTINFGSCFTITTKLKIFKFFKDKIFNELDLIEIEKRINFKLDIKDFKSADISKSEVRK